MPGKVYAETSPRRQTEEAAMFPSSILAELLPGSIHEKDNIFSAKIEGYLNDLISHLLSFKSQNRLIRQSVVAIATESNLNSLSTVSTRDVCRTIRNFSGLSIPDVTSITRVPHAVEAAQAVPATPSAADLTSQSPTMNGHNIEEDIHAVPLGVGVGGLRPGQRKRAVVMIPSNLPPKIPKKRGRPSNKDRGIV